jgi:hypothetical protein
MGPLFSFLAVSLALVLGSLQSSLAAPNPRGLHLSAMIPRLKESILPPRHWIDLGPAPPTEVITLRIGLPQARFSELERQLYEISDPRHERYGQHLMKEQVDELVRPDPRSVEAVDAWLVELGIPEGGRIQRSRAGDWVTILVPIAQAEQMLHTVSPGVVPFPPKIPFRSFCPFSHLRRPLHLCIACRSSTSGSIPATATCSSVQRTTAFPSTSMRTSI